MSTTGGRAVDPSRPDIGVNGFEVTDLCVTDGDRVAMGGVSLQHAASRDRGVAIQDIGRYPGLTVQDNSKFFADLPRVPAKLPPGESPSGSQPSPTDIGSPVCSTERRL
jgi:hypothetical protein